MGFDQFWRGFVAAGTGHDEHVSGWYGVLLTAASAAVGVWGIATDRTGTGIVWLFLAAIGASGWWLSRRRSRVTVDPRRQLLLFTVLLTLVEVGFIVAAITAPGDGWRGATGMAIVLLMPLAFLSWALWSSKTHGSKEEGQRLGS